MAETFEGLFHAVDLTQPRNRRFSGNRTGYTRPKEERLEFMNVGKMKRE